MIPIPAKAANSSPAQVPGEEPAANIATYKIL